MGWAARLAAHWCPYNSTLFSLQISILIICKFSPFPGYAPTRVLQLLMQQRSALLLQCWHLLHSWPTHRQVGTAIQLALCQALPLDLHLFRHPVDCHPGRWWGPRVFRFIFHPSDFHSDRYPSDDGRYHHPACLHERLLCSLRLDCLERSRFVDVFYRRSLQV